MKKRLSLLAVPILLVALHSFYWQWMSRSLDDGLRAWTARRIAAGWRIGTAAPVGGGWPLAATLTLPAPVVTAPDGTTWTAERVVLRIDLLRPGRLRADAAGHQRLTLGSGGQIALTADRMRLDLPLAELRFTGADAPAEFSLAATGISLPPSPASSLGSSIASLSATGNVSHVAELPEAGITTQARRWRDYGGTLDLRDFALNWGSLDVTGSATLALDDRLQPKGDAAAEITGFAPAIAQLTDAGAIPPQGAMLATAALTLLAGTTGTAAIPLHLEAGRLSARQIPLLAVPEIAWPPR